MDFNNDQAFRYRLLTQRNIPHYTNHRLEVLWLHG